MTHESLALLSFAKINWNLHIIGKRADGFHELFTIFQTVSLSDRIVFQTADELVLTCDDPRIPTGETNLIIKAALALREKFAVKTGARIHLEKRIPAPGGLGGGSSNAAVALLGLKKLWKIEATDEELHEIAESLGSDVPFFLYGGSAIGTGRGTEIEPLADRREKFMLVVTPAVDVPTGAAFARLGAPLLTNADSKSILQICRKAAAAPILDYRKLINDFERSVFALAPEIEEVKQTLLDCGARHALLSGSGASVYAVFDKAETRQTTIEQIEKSHDWRMFAVATVSREEYRAALGL